MGAHVRSVNVGRLEPSPHTRAAAGTAIRKRPVAAIEVRDPGPQRGGLGSGVVGDEVGSRKHHGGSDQAVYAVAREELDWWAKDIGRPIADGEFGENLTTEGLDVDAAVVGSVWQLGSAQLAVTGPRVPCRTFAGHMGEGAWVKRFTARGRTGAYLAVLAPGTIRAGERIVVVAVPEHGFTVPQAFRAWMGDRALAEAFIDAGVGSESFRAQLRERVLR